ncbi:uncharacterized protein LOC111041058 [Myzus persicae]|uniref:uncharacterized protein LOC111041058 n=1 Tax=Myzus persicae TaxID=13164 RepID=UPI000B93132E|nr:uncharacterized protein LOC111041058 [Myzus persicae]
MIARIFDPLGLLSPSTFYAKTIMQRMWLAQVDWDSQIPEDIVNDCYGLCGFCDASEKGYAAVVYLRVTDPSGAIAISVYLMGAKTKLAPMKAMTIPRLELSVETWTQDFSCLSLEHLPETKPVCLVTRVEPRVEWSLRFSSFNQMIRRTAQVLRFIQMCRKRSVELGFLRQSELNAALHVVVKDAQNRYLSELVNNLHKGTTIQFKPLAHLCPFLDPVDLLRVGGRMQNSNWSERRKHPILIPKESYLAVLIACHWHLYACHARPRLLIALIQQQFWIIGIRLIVNRVIRKCLISAKMSAANPQPIMAALPSFRVQEAHPFSMVGIDYAGPLQMKEISLRKARIVKVYIAIFVCMTTKAVHLESVTALSTDAFRLTLDRFVARRGLPTKIYSDCGTNFVGAGRQLRHLVNHPDNRDQLASHIACEWHLNPPGAPHFGGIWEAAVKSAKSLLLRAMSSQVWTLEEFTTVLCRVEAAMNSRLLHLIRMTSNA